MYIFAGGRRRVVVLFTMLHLLGFGWQAYVVVFLIVLVLVYLVLLELRLQCSHPDAVPFTAPPMSEKDLLNTTYNLSDSWTYKLPEPHLDSIHVVVGGSGSLGAAVCRLLMERGHRLRIVDMQVCACHERFRTLTKHMNLFFKLNITLADMFILLLWNCLSFVILAD